MDYTCALKRRVHAHGAIVERAYALVVHVEVDRLSSSRDFRVTRRGWRGRSEGLPIGLIRGLELPPDVRRDGLAVDERNEGLPGPPEVRREEGLLFKLRIGFALISSVTCCGVCVDVTPLLKRVPM